MSGLRPRHLFWYIYFMEKNKRINKNIIYAGLALLVIILYLIIDGWEMIATSVNIIKGNNAVDDDTLTDIMQRTDKAYIIKNMIGLYISRILYLVLVLFPISFTAVKYHISFKSKGKSDFQKIFPYLRVVLGFMGFYYVLTLGTTYPHALFVTYYSFGPWTVFFRLVGAFVILASFIIDWPALISAIREFPSSYPRMYKVTFVIFISLLSCMILEYQVGSKMRMDSNMVIFNILYWLLIQVFFDVITRNVKVGAFVSLGLAYLIGLANDIVYQFRGNYIMYGDLTVVRTALEVAGNYTYKPGFWFWLAIVLLISGIAVTVFLKFSKREKPQLKELLIRLGITIALVAGVGVAFTTGWLYNNVFGVGWDYNTNVMHTGYIPYFLSNMNSIASVTLDGYEADLALQALDSASIQVGEHAYPNIIIIQNEAFSDLSILFDIETNADYMPFIHSLTDNTRKGYLNMSLTGGPTANTEFEILTRSTLGFLPYGAVPYTQYVNDDLPTAVQVLRNQAVPYHTVAYHPYYSSGYSRTNVYNHFGFDEIVFENNFREDFPEADLPRDYLSDSADYRRVEQMYEEFRSQSDDPWFCFNVTIQNHGGYTQVYEPAAEDRIYVTNFEATDSLNSYLSLIKTSDDAFRELIEYFSQCDEPTIIAMYGDHQPTLDNETYELLEPYAKGPIYQYYVPYIIWANFDIEEADTLGDLENEPVLNTLSTNYFASTVFETAGVELSDYDRYLLDLHEDVPAITAIGIWDSEGNYYSSPSLTPYADELTALQMVQYNLIFDDENRLTDRFE